MTFKRKIIAFVAICITAILAIALCGCEDLGAYSSTEDYYASFGDVILIGGNAENGKKYSVEDYFYNEESRQDFLTGEDGAYKGIEQSDYVYVAIPLNRDLKMDSLAMYLQAQDDVTLYINVYVTDKTPTNWKKLDEAGAENGASVERFEDTLNDTEGGAQDYDDPDPQTRVGDITLYLKDGKWNSFTLDNFKVDGLFEKSIQLKSGQYILLQIRNNSGVRDFDEKTGLYIDAQTGLALEKAEITMTNLLIRAIE